VGCQLNYEIKHDSIANPEARIYRVTNEFHYVSLCAAGRFGYDFENRAQKDENAFENAISALQKADSIAFDSFITNEEALILQRMKEKLGVKLVNEDARAYGEFLDAYSSISGQSIYGGDLASVNESDFVISVGSFLRSDSPNSRYAFNNAQKLNKGAGIYFHPIKDNLVETYGKNVLQVNHKPGLETAVLYLILDLFGKDLPQELQTYLDSFKYETTETVTETIKEEKIEQAEEVEVDKETGEEKRVLKDVKKMVPKKVQKEVTVTKNKLLEILDAPADFEQKLEKALKKKEKFSLIAGEDLIAAKNASQLAKLLGAVEKYTGMNLVIIPPKTNTLGVSLICDLDRPGQGYTVGYNTEGDFTLSALGGGDLDMPALNQQEGTFTNINKKVVPTNAALGYEGYTLNDLANAVGIISEETIDYTPQLGGLEHFSAKAFDDLPNYFSNDRSEHRGYSLTSAPRRTEQVQWPQIAQGNDQTVVYRANPLKQFNAFTKRAHELRDSAKIYMPQELADKLEVQEGNMFAFTVAGKELSLPVGIDNKIGGQIAYLPDFDENFDAEKLFAGQRYRSISLNKG
jgi:NADH-quinone oxidoreductase subunit G